MATATWEPARTTTGLDLDLVRTLRLDDQEALYRFHRTHAGNGGTWLPWAVRRMPLESRLELAYDLAREAAWELRELERCRDPEGGARYFIEAYGHVKPPRSQPVPFLMWPAQAEVLEELRAAVKAWILKARRLGLSWLALHYAAWVCGFNLETPGARALVICKNLADAGKLLDRTKDIFRLLPPYLALRLGKDSASALELEDRDAEIWALPATEAAARLETADLVILDEFAFPRHGVAGRIWTAVQPTIEGGGQAIGISTGNGRTGDGETFAEVWDQAEAGDSSIKPIFLPWWARPDRTAEWREEQRKDYLSDEDFEAEYPDTPEQALAGGGIVNVYPKSHLAAASRLGELIEATPHWVELVAEGVEWGIDWGDFQTFTLYAVGLPGGGAFIFDELVQSHTEPSKASEEIIGHEPAGMAEVRFTRSAADSAPAGTNSTFSAVLDQARRREPRRFPDEHIRVPFSTYKEGGGERRGVNTVGYIQRLLRKTAELMEGEGWDGEPGKLHGVLAIHPRCETYLAQARNLERDPATAKVRKPKLDPKNITKGDHGPDASVALLAGRAAEWTALVGEDEEDG